MSDLISSQCAAGRQTGGTEGQTKGWADLYVESHAGLREREKERDGKTDWKTNRQTGLQPCWCQRVALFMVCLLCTTQTSVSLYLPCTVHTCQNTYNPTARVQICILYFAYVCKYVCMHACTWEYNIYLPRVQYRIHIADYSESTVDLDFSMFLYG